MTNSVIYLTLEQILVVHEDQIDRYGGSHGLRDLALLESAVFRPQTTFSSNDLYPEIFDKAAAILHSLIFNHPFIDGNKRTATASMIIFLSLNKYELNIDQIMLVKIILQIEAEKWNIDRISKWIKNQIHR